MSTLRVNTVQNQPGTGAPDINGLAKAWVNFNGTGTVAIRAALNVSSITDNGTGNYTINFTTPMVDANYAVVANNGNNISQNTSANVTNINSASNFSFVHYEQNTAQDISQLFAAVFR